MTRFLSAALIFLIALGSYLAFSGFRAETILEPETEPAPEEWVMDDKLAFYLDEFARNFEEGMMEENIPGAAVVIVKDGRVVFQRGFGVKERGKADPVDENTIFRLGSLSKGFASVLAAMLEEEGTINWDEPVSEVVPYFMLHNPEQSSRIRVSHLLSHTTGLPRHAYTNLIEDGLTLENIIPRLHQVPLVAREGTQHSYQNVAFSVIEKVIEARTESNFNTLLQERLFVPLEMNHTSSNYAGIFNAENRATPHIFHSQNRGRLPVPINRNYYNAVSSGGINASAVDLGKWLLLLTGHYPDVVSMDALETIYDPVVTIRSRRFSRHWDGVNQSHYGLGWRVLYNHGQRIVYHGGYVNGFRSEIAFSPERRTGIAILINTHSSYPLTVIPDFFNHFYANPVAISAE